MSDEIDRALEEMRRELAGMRSLAMQVDMLRRQLGDVRGKVQEERGRHVQGDAQHFGWWRPCVDENGALYVSGGVVRAGQRASMWMPGNTFTAKTTDGLEVVWVEGVVDPLNGYFTEFGQPSQDNGSLDTFAQTAGALWPVAVYAVEGSQIVAAAPVHVGQIHFPVGVLRYTNGLDFLYYVSWEHEDTPGIALDWGSQPLPNDGTGTGVVNVSSW